MNEFSSKKYEVGAAWAGNNSGKSISEIFTNSKNEYGDIN